MHNKNKGNKRSHRQKSVAKPQTSSPSLAAPLSAGTPAPDFALKSTPDQTVSLREFRNRPVVLVFYPADFSPVCGDEMALFNEILPEFNRFNAQLLGISEDGVWSHIASPEPEI
jgi:peroxiredoxin